MPDARSSPPGPLTPEQVSMLTTEHFTLQTAKAATISEASGRASLYLGALSSALIALTLLNTATRGGAAFQITAFVIGPTLVFLGLFVYLRVLQNALEDAMYGRAINRVRHAYLEAAPQLERYFSLSDRDDTRGFSQNMATLPGERGYQILVTTASAVGILNSVLTGVLAGGALAALGLSLGWALGAGVGVGLLSIWGYVRYQQGAWQALERRMPPRFPSDPQE